MTAVKLTADVFCQKDWDRNPVYRVYVNEDLLTERTWIWPSYEFYIKENIIVDLEPGPHKIILQTVSPESDNIIFRNLTVNGVVVPKSAKADNQQYTFHIVKSSNGNIALNILYLDL